MDGDVELVVAGLNVAITDIQADDVPTVNVAATV